MILFGSLCSNLGDKTVIHITELICKVVQSVVSLNSLICRMRGVGLHLKHALNLPLKKPCQFTAQI